MTVSIDITDNEVFTALRSLLLTLLPDGVEVVRGQQSRVSMPVGGFVTMNSILQQRLATNLTSYAPVTDTKTVEVATRYDIQLDFYGPNAQAWAMQMQALFRDEYAVQNMPDNIQPLYADDPSQMPLIDAQSQYEQRWKLTASLQYNPVITVGQDFAATLVVIPESVDAVFPP